MGKIEDKDRQFRNKMAEHAEREIYSGASVGYGARKRQLEAEAEDEPGAEGFFAGD